MPEELKKALTISWLIISIGMSASILAAFALPGKVLGALPVCEAKKAGGSCPACGLTTAFRRAASGDFAGARKANSASMFVLGSFALNSIASGTYFTLKVRKKLNN